MTTDATTRIGDKRYGLQERPAAISSGKFRDGFRQHLYVKAPKVAGEAQAGW